MSKLLALAAIAIVSLTAAPKTPVVVELFTSEGCSSCPPADDLLAQLSAKQPIEGVDIIVLSEHVDYWNQLGWKDPFSAAVFSERQRRYSVSLHAEDVYTPQAVVDGYQGLVGSNGKQLLSAIKSAARESKTPLVLAAERHGNAVSVKVDGGGEIWVALVEAKTVSHVIQGENSGRTLLHVGVVRSLQPLKNGSGTLTINPGWKSTALKVVAFAQDKHSMKILGAAQADL